MSNSTISDVTANAFAILVGCIAVYVAVAKKVLRKKTKISKLWLSIEIGSCIIAIFIGFETYSFVDDILPWLSKNLYVVICAYLGTRLVNAVEERTLKAVSSK